MNTYPHEADEWFRTVSDLQQEYIDGKASPDVLIFSMLTNIFVFLIQWRFQK